MAYKKYTKKDFLEFASGFDYFKTDKKKFIGNSVVPLIAQKLIESNRVTLKKLHTTIRFFYNIQFKMSSKVFLN